MKSWTITPGIERLSSPPVLLEAVRDAARGKRSRPEVAAFCMDAERHVLTLGERLRVAPGKVGAWVPSLPRTRWIRDPKPRMIAVVPFVDRVVQHALCQELVPALERGAIFDSWGSREGKGSVGALRRARSFARRWPWVLKLDVSRFFASIPHDGLARLLRRRVEDPGVRAWLLAVVHTGGVDRGLPIGSLVSQHLANAYLGAVDHLVKDQLGVRGYVRYMDDMLLFGQRDELPALRSRVVERLALLGLVLNERVSGYFALSRGVPFLGWRVSQDRVVPRVQTRARWARRVRRAASQPEEDVAASVLSATAHLLSFDTSRLRRRVLRDLEGGGGRLKAGGPAAFPGDPGRLLEERRVQPTRRQPEQERPVHLQEHPRPPARPFRPAAGLVAGTPDGGSSWAALLREGADPAVVPGGGLRPALYTPAPHEPPVRPELVGGPFRSVSDRVRP